jgi:bifunctional non-homologous end joining protein LigD
MTGPDSAYRRKRRFEQTPEPPPATEGSEVDPLSAMPGTRFVIQQHYATRLHHDVRLEMMSGATPVLVSWAVPKGLPRRKGVKVLAVRTEDHPEAYATFSGSIPEGNYGAGEVRIFDAGAYEIVKRDEEKLTFRLDGKRLQGIYHLIRTGLDEGKERWLALLSEDRRPPPEPLPPLDPMLAIPASEPFDDPSFLFEPKWDGVRALAVCREGTTLVSRRRNDITAGYPELAHLHDRAVALDAVFDGEIVSFVDGLPSFQMLQKRMHVRDPRQLERLVRASPVVYMAFDLLYLDGHSLTTETLRERRRLLEEVLVAGETVQLSPIVTGDGRALYAAAFAQGLEGIVAKRASSPYEPGARPRSWLKVKFVLDADVVIAGWIEGSGRRQGELGSLVMGLYDGDELRYIGNVGTGFDQRSLSEATEQLRRLDATANPFPAAVTKSRPELRSAHWVAPTLVATVEYRQLTNAGRMRAPSFKRFRTDKSPGECTVDQLPSAGSAGEGSRHRQEPGQHRSGWSNRPDDH